MPGPVHRLHVEHSERQSTLLDAGRRCGTFDVRMVRLAAGDYLIADKVLIERKTVADCAASLVDGRLFPQVARLARSHYRSILLIELDTSVLVAAMRSDRGASRALLVDALERRHELLASVPLMIEYEAVLTRPEHLATSGLSADDLGAILDGLAVVAVRVRLAHLWRPALADATDDMVLETAVNGGRTSS